MNLIEQAKQEFINVFGDEPTHYGIAPGRVEVLGNHTDYNHGFILSAAIDRHIVVCGRRVEGDTAHVFSRSFKSGETFKVSSPQKTKSGFWINYMMGVVDELRKQGIALGGFEALVISDVPLGAGLSSSAAFEVATALFLKEIYPYAMEQVDVALLCQAAENNFVGVGCGILDQFSSAMGKEDHLIFLDCRHLTKYELIPLGSGIELVLANTNASHDLAEGTYNKLQADCFTAADYFASKITGVTHLRDVSVKEFEKHSSVLAEEVMKRARHIVTENARVLSGVESLKSGDRTAMGKRMCESHASSRNDFGNSCEELNVMVDCADGIPGCLGSRLSGGGFGGCTVNLVEAEKAEAFAEELANRYQKRTGIAPQMHICRASDGASGCVL